MTKKELIAKMAERAETTKTNTEKVLDAFQDTVIEALRNGDEVQLVGFGKFSVTERAAREGRNPQTGEPVHIAASKSPKFKPGTAFKDAVK